MMADQQIKGSRDWSRRMHFFASASRLAIHRLRGTGFLLLAGPWSKHLLHSHHAQWILQYRVLRGISEHLQI